MSTIPAAIALVIMMNGWSDGAPAVKGNAIDHIPGFTSIERCNEAGEKIRGASINLATKTVCVETFEPVADSAGDIYVLTILISGWTNNGGGAQGNAIDFIPGYPSTTACENVGKTIAENSNNKGVIRTVCIKL